MDVVVLAWRRRHDHAIDHRFTADRSTATVKIELDVEACYYKMVMKWVIRVHVYGEVAAGDQRQVL